MTGSDKMSNVVSLTSLVLACKDRVRRTEYAETLRSAGYAVVEAGSAAEAIERFGSRDYGLLVCEGDLGDDTAGSMLRALDVMLTGGAKQRTLVISDEHWREHYGDATSVVAAPLTPSALIDAVRAAFSRHI